MWKTVVAGGLVGAALFGGGGIATAAPVEVADTGSAASGSAVYDALEVVIGLPYYLFLRCPLGPALGSTECPPMSPIGPTGDEAPVYDGSADLGALTGSANSGSATVTSFLLCGIGSDLGSGYCP
ncbi:hypothetical protein ACIO14_06555 [Nocardia fluminea]|uniref:hypothetical protein n=1 Tax=Nocardia fluminea TaxID=134984 RepID=UPI003803EDB3